MVIENDRLKGSGVLQLGCKKNKKALVERDTIVLHYTASGGAMSTAQYLRQNEVDQSAHLIIARDGRVIQLVDFATQAWHAGKSKHEGRSFLNQFSIGIELQNAGKLHCRNGKFYSWFNHEYPANEVYIHREGEHVSYWHDYTLNQLSRLEEIVLLLIETYGIRFFVRHSDISVRKLDPGPAFPEGFLGRWRMMNGEE